MIVSELIELLKKMPQDLPVEINDNLAGQISYIDSVYHFYLGDGRLSAEDGDYDVVILQTNCA